MPKWNSGQGRRSSSIHRCLPLRRTARTRRPRRAAAKRDGRDAVVHDRVGDDGHGDDAAGPAGPARRGGARSRPRAARALRVRAYQSALRARRRGV